MQIVEVKNDTAKIIYNPAENYLLPYDFILIEDNNYKLISQVINIETDNNSENNSAVLKLALFLDENDNLSYYNGFIPSKNSKLVFINSSEIISLLKEESENINFGCLVNHPNCTMETGISILDKKLYIQSDRNEKTKYIINKIANELNKLNKKLVILDFNKRYCNIGGTIIKIADNFKLPLNIDAFNTILKYDIQDCPIEDKALIQSIILELREYLKTLEDKFIPFNVFKQVVDNEFLANPVSGLMLLRNKLWYYAQEAIFADLKKQFEIINEKIKEQNLIIIDVSDLSEFWNEFILKTVTELINNKCYMFFSIDDVNTDRKHIEKIYNSENVTPIISSSYNSRYNDILKSLCSNSILCKPSVYNAEQETYSFLLNRINNDEMVLYGESTLYIPLIIDTKKTSEIREIHHNSQEIKQEYENIEQTVQSENNIVEIIDEIPVIDVEETKTQEEKDEFPDIYVEEPETQVSEDDILDSDLDFLDEIDRTEKPEIISSEDSNGDEVIEGTEILSEEADEIDDIQIPEDNQSEQAVVETEQTVEEEFLGDEEQLLGEEEQILKEEEQTDDEIVNLDDFIEDIVINSENKDKSEEDALLKEEPDTLEETEINNEIEEKQNANVENVETGAYEINAEEEKEQNIETAHNNEIKAETISQSGEKTDIRNNSELPIYETDLPESLSVDSLPFKVGDKVYHPKHGNGIVEGFANYSNKILFCQIEFENVGRRILDPRIAGIEKVS